MRREPLFAVTSVYGERAQRRRHLPSIALYGMSDGPQYRSTGRDFGVVTGVFFGEGHEGMGGVIERHDMSAAFGGKRSAPSLQ